MDILTTIHNRMPSFSKGQKRIANYIDSSYDKAAFMTASKLGDVVNVSESTVVRFAVELGFDGYPSMQKALQEMVRNRCYKRSFRQSGCGFGRPPFRYGKYPNDQRVFGSRDTETGGGGHYKGTTHLYRWCSLLRGHRHLYEFLFPQYF